jgi:hypothetical protein
MPIRRAPLLLIAWLLFAPVARGDEAANTATARALGTEGVVLADEGRCPEAIEKLSRAEALHHAPTTAVRLAECEIEVGKIVVGTERLQRLVREPLATNAPPVFAAAIARAQHALESALPRVGTLRLAVKAPSGAKFTIAIDDEPAPEAIVDGIRQIDPGVHRIRVSAPGFVPRTVSATIEEGRTKHVSVELEPEPTSAVGPSSASSSTATAPTGAASLLPVYLAFAVGALGIGVGSYAGVVVARKAATLSSECGPSRVCPADRQADISATKLWATVSTAGFITAGAAIGTGIVLLMTRGRASPTQGGRRVRPSVGLGGVAIDGVF